MPFQFLFSLILITFFCAAHLGATESVSDSCARVLAVKSKRVIEIQKTVFSGFTRRKVKIYKSDGQQKGKAERRVLLYFHGTDSPTELHHASDAPYGLHNESRFIQELALKGFVVIAPEAGWIPGLSSSGLPKFYQAWEANIYPYSFSFKNGKDHALVSDLFSQMENLAEESIDLNQVWIAGFSSGGYMASRIANEEHFARQLRGVMIHSASYGTCLMNVCEIPDHLPDWHPQTLLVANDDDAIVPASTVRMYERILRENGIDVKTIYNTEGGHSWRPDQLAHIKKWILK